MRSRHKPDGVAIATGHHGSTKYETQASKQTG